jgi:hypothetical protein
MSFGEGNTWAVKSVPKGHRIKEKFSARGRKQKEQEYLHAQKIICSPKDNAPKMMH